MFSRQEDTSNSEQPNSENCLANQLFYAEHDFFTTWRREPANLARLLSQFNRFGEELHLTHRYD